MSALIDSELLPAWADKVHASQMTFRCALDALAEPGLVHVLPVSVTGPRPLHASTTALCLALTDYETPVWCDPVLGTEAIRAYLRFHCGCPLVEEADTAAFALIGDPSALSLDKFQPGTMEYPDRSATLLVQVTSLEDGPERILAGPGIESTRVMRVAGLPEDFDQAWSDNTAGFPLGVDIIFCCGEKMVGLPRTTRVEG